MLLKIPKDTELEEDFNPTEYDRKMQELFDEEFYDKTDYAKPVFDEKEDEFIVSFVIHTFIYYNFTKFYIFLIML